MTNLPAADPETGENPVSSEEVAVPREIPPAARRALKEAAERHLSRSTHSLPEEVGGRGGQDPARYGDWEVKGLASDF
ncbi:MAG: DUF1674 domain-containing protein [Methylocystis sp.]|jgi:hypothetical protein